MAEMNPLEVINECIEKAKATTDRDQIAHILAETLGILQIDNTEDDAFAMLSAAIGDTVDKDKAHSAHLFEVWTQLEKQRQSR
jgi:hypothetical protein